MVNSTEPFSDDQKMTAAEMNARNSAQTMVETLARLGASPNRVKEAIDELQKHAEDVAKIALTRVWHRESGDGSKVGR